MEIKNILREDLWKAIQAHYERNDYTESVRDCMYHICDVLREKSGLQDKDGTKLVESTLMGSNPAIQINKNETTTEKDIQQGIGFAFKGLMQSIRNPLSHDKAFSLSQTDADSIVAYANYLLNQVDKSLGTAKVDDIIGLLLDEDFTDTEEYALLLLKEVPINKRYDLLLDLFKMRESLPERKLKFFVAALMKSLTKAAKSSFDQVISKSLMKCRDDRALRMYCHYFMTDTFNSIDKLAQLRIEDLAIKSIQKGEATYKLDSETKNTDLICSTEGTLGTWFNNRLELMSNRDSIIDLLLRKTERGEESENYVFEYFSEVLDNLLNGHYEFTSSQVSLIKRKLTAGDQYFYDLLFEYIDFIKDEKYIELFGAEYNKCKEIMDTGKEALPF